ncbi:MAG: recombinase family protein [Erysipelotrichaceae bacterium]|nr:recombinase family protein [Erysipelotrichaceae bacterium]
MKNEIRNVAIYCRVSTEEQRKFGISVEDQKNSLTRYCKENKLKIYDYYIDEGVSAGTIAKRKEFVRLLKDLDNIDLIIFTKLDRFSRNVRDANNLLVELDKHNTAFRAIDEDDIDISTSDGRFIFNLKVNLAEHERNKDSERINRVNKYKYHTARTVCSGAKIFGYDIDKNKRLVINEEEADQINQLFDKYIETNNLSETTRWFQKNIKKRSYESVRLYLTNTAYIGQYRHIRKKTKEIEIIEDFSPTIVDIEKFNKVQKLLKSNVKKHTGTSENGNKTDYIFNRFIYCKCGRKLAGKHSKGKHYYICKNALTDLCDNHIHISELNLEKYLLDNIESCIEEEINKLENKHLNEQKCKKNNPNEKVQLKKKLQKLTNLYLEDMIELDIYKKEYSTLKLQLEELETEEQSEEKMDFSKLKEFLESDWQILYHKLENKEKREFWMTIIDSIVFESKEKFEIKFKLY